MPLPSALSLPPPLPPHSPLLLSLIHAGSEYLTQVLRLASHSDRIDRVISLPICFRFKGKYGNSYSRTLSFHMEVCEHWKPCHKPRSDFSRATLLLHPSPLLNEKRTLTSHLLFILRSDQWAPLPLPADFHFCLMAELFRDLMGSTVQHTHTAQGANKKFTHWSLTYMNYSLTTIHQGIRSLWQ